MTTFQNSFLASFLVAAVCGTSASAGGKLPVAPDLRLKAEAGIKAALAKYSSLSARLEELSETRIVRAAGPVGSLAFQPHTRRDRITYLDQNAIVDRRYSFDNEPNRPRIRLECDNADYYFTLGKNKESDAFHLVDLGIGKRKSPLATQDGTLHGLVFGYLRQGLAAAAKEPGANLQVLQMDSVKGLLDMEYKFGEPPVKVWLRLDPSREWLVIERKIETTTLIATERFDYGNVLEGVTFPTEMRHVTIYKIPQAPPNLNITQRVLSLTLTDKVPADFRMTAFGLPEPIGVPPVNRASPWYLWLAIGAIVFIGLAIGVVKLHRRTASRVAVASSKVK